MDTAEKRRSAAGVPYLPLGPGVTPNAGQDQEWRQQAGWGYSGILAGELEVVTAPLVTDRLDFVQTHTDRLDFVQTVTDRVNFVE